MFIFLALFFLVLLFASDLASASNGFAVYRDTTGNTVPTVRFWNSSDNAGNGSWSSPVSLATAGSAINYVVLKQSPISSKVALVTLGNDGYLDLYTCIFNCTRAAQWTVTNNFGRVWLAAAAQRRFDIEFSTQNDDLMIVYNSINTTRGASLRYKVLPHANLSLTGFPEYFANDTMAVGITNYSWIALDRDPVKTSNELVVTAFDLINQSIHAWVWNGTGWGNEALISKYAPSTGNYEALDVKYSYDGSSAMVVGGNSTTGGAAYRYWNGNAWSNALSVDINGGSNNDVRWATLKSNPVSNTFQALLVDSGNDLWTSYWNGASWTTIASAIDADIDLSTRRCADYEWYPDGASGVVVWDSDTATGTNLNYTICSPNCNGARLLMSSVYAAGGEWVALYRNPDASELVKVLGIRLNSANALGSLFSTASGTYVNYGDTALVANTGINANNVFFFAFNADHASPNLSFVSPTPNSSTLQGNTFFYVNISSNEVLSSAVVELNSTSGMTNYSMSSSLSSDTFMDWYINITGLAEGFYNYKVYGIDFANNTGISELRNITIDYPPNITLIYPPNNTMNTTSKNITFQYIVNDTLDDVSVCSLVINGSIVANASGGSIVEGSVLNFSYVLSNKGWYNWSIRCNDTRNYVGDSEIRNLTISISSQLAGIWLSDTFSPLGQLMLSAGSVRFVNCSVVASDPDGVSNVRNATATFYYYLNKSSDPDNNNTHYTNSSCSRVENTSTNVSFSCGFYVLYYANNGTWTCNATVTNNYSVSISDTVSSTIQPLYAVNVTDGVDFSKVSAVSPSANVTVNISNFGNMLVNVTVQGYDIVIGDNIGMNCSDGSNITITNIRFSTNNTADFSSKTPLSGAIQSLNFKINKQINSSQVFNTTYWQITPDPGKLNRICGGYIIFTAEAP